MEEDERKQSDLLLVAAGETRRIIFRPVKVFIVDEKRKNEGGRKRKREREGEGEGMEHADHTSQLGEFLSAGPRTRARAAAIYKEKLRPRDRVMSSRCKYCVQLSVDGAPRG